MTGFRFRTGWIVPAFLVAVAVLASGVWRYGYLQALDQLAQRAESDMALASDRLAAQLQIYQELAVLTASHPALSGLEVPTRAEAADALLRATADKTGAMDVLFADTDGHVLAAAREEPQGNLAAMPYFRRAMQGALGAGHGTDAESGRRIFAFAVPAFAADGHVRGALAFIADAELVEQAWRGDTPAVFFTDETGEVFISNRDELLFWRRVPGMPGLVPADDTPPPFSARWTGRHEIWRLDWGPYLPKRALHLARNMPVIGLTGEVLVDVAPARRLAGLQAAAVAAICLAFGAMLHLATVRRRALAEANAVLEARVSERTMELSAANTKLRREVWERKEAEAALKKAQADLVQAAKLSALGQMSAGISHELNQPLMAIGSFAENGALFLERGQTETAAENLGRISELARRMGRIIRNLRAFARQESEAPEKVDIVQVLDGVLELAGPRMRQDGVELDYDRPAQPVWVLGGEVRLGQVFLNLVTNAMDAMAASDRRVLGLSISGGDPLTVDVRDTGPGIDDPGKVFDPFYTTKAVGAAEGMGLGLSISYGIVQSFGGDIRGRNLDDGAVFSVRLERWREEQVA